MKRINKKQRGRQHSERLNLDNFEGEMEYKLPLSLEVGQQQMQKQEFEVNGFTGNTQTT